MSGNRIGNKVFDWEWMEMGMGMKREMITRE